MNCEYNNVNHKIGFNRSCCGSITQWKREGCIGSWWGDRREEDHREDLGVDGWIILGWICGERRVYRVLVGKPEGRRPLGRPRRRWVDNIRLDLWGEGGV